MKKLATIHWLLYLIFSPLAIFFFFPFEFIIIQVTGQAELSPCYLGQIGIGCLLRETLAL